MLSNLLPKLNEYEYELLTNCLKTVINLDIGPDKVEVLKLLNTIQDRTINLNDFKGE